MLFMNRLFFTVAVTSAAVLSGCAAPVKLAQFSPMRSVKHVVGLPLPVQPPVPTIKLIRRGPPPAPAPTPVWVNKPARAEATAQFPFGGVRVEDPARLDALARRAKSINTLNSVEITGFTDSIGSPRDNLRLSLRRALFVKALLIARGVPADKITVVGAGATQFLVSPDSCHGTLHDQAVCQARNRRVQIDVAGTVRVLVPGR